MTDRPKLTEEERLAKLCKLDNTPSPNPLYKGLTPGDAARAINAAPPSGEAPVKGVSSIRYNPLTVRAPIRLCVGLLLLTLTATACGGEQETAESTLDALRSAAEQGDADAQYSLGDSYEHGTGVPEDDAEAVRWYRMAAEQGHLDAQYRLASGGDVLSWSELLPVDVAESRHWYRMAAEQGHTEAQYSLADMYYGNGVPEDMAEAVRWYRVVAEQGDGIVQDEVVRLTRMAAKQTLGDIYASGEGVPQSDVEALSWYGLAADQGSAYSQERLGDMYYRGEGVPQSYVRAVSWYGLAADQGSAYAQGRLGDIYYWGGDTFILRNPSEAAKWYRRAAEQGDASAQALLGVIYERGEGALKDIVLAHMWYNIAGANGDGPAGRVRDRLEGEMTRAEINLASELARACMASDYEDCER